MAVSFDSLIAEGEGEVVLYVDGKKTRTVIGAGRLRSGWCEKTRNTIDYHAYPVTMSIGGGEFRGDMRGLMIFYPALGAEEIAEIRGAG